METEELNIVQTLMANRSKLPHYVQASLQAVDVMPKIQRRGWDMFEERPAAEVLKAAMQHHDEGSLFRGAATSDALEDACMAVGDEVEAEEDAEDNLLGAPEKPRRRRRQEEAGGGRRRQEEAGGGRRRRRRQEEAGGGRRRQEEAGGGRRRRKMQQRRPRATPMTRAFFWHESCSLCADIREPQSA